MQRPVIFALALAACAAASAGTNVGVSIGINQPGAYGRIDIGNYPSPPPIVHAQPVVIVPTPVAVYQQPIYLYVPRGHQRNWRKHCRHYGACGQPVYFVQERWVHEHHHRRHHDDDDDDRGRRKYKGGDRGRDD